MTLFLVGLAVFCLSSVLVYGLIKYLIAPETMTERTKEVVICSAFLFSAFLATAYQSVPRLFV